MADTTDPSRLSTAEAAALSARVRETLTPIFVADVLRAGLPEYPARVLDGGGRRRVRARPPAPRP